MTKKFVNIYLSTLTSAGHKKTQDLLAIELKEFCVCSPIYTNEENLFELTESTYGAFLFTDNLEFVNGITSFISQLIESQIDLYSDLFSSIIKIYVLQIHTDSYRIIIEMNSASILQVV